MPSHYFFDVWELLSLLDYSRVGLKIIHSNASHHMMMVFRRDQMYRVRERFIAYTSFAYQSIADKSASDAIHLIPTKHW
jgi:hypothetical protein